MRDDALDALRRGVEVPVRVTPKALAAAGDARALRGVLIAFDLTDAGYVACHYPGKDYGPTLHHRDLMANPPNG